MLDLIKFLVGQLCTPHFRQQLNMAESSSKPGIFAKAQKTISRTKTKVLQNLGRAEKTTDDTFTDNVQKIDKQQEVAHHLQKELKQYVHCIKDLCQASKSLQTAIQETYETEWTEEASFKSHLQASELLYTDFLQNVQDSTMVPLHTYLMSFPVLKNKIAKRGRKMVDYDNARHNFETLQAAKKKDELKIQKAQDDLKEAKRIYEDLNNDLHMELPDFYNSRVSFYAELFTSLFGAEHKFHTELGKSNSSLYDISQELGKEYSSFVYMPKRPLSKSLSTNSENGLNGDTSGLSSPSSPGFATSSPAVHSPVSPTSTASTKGDFTQPTYTNDSQSETTSGNATTGYTNGNEPQTISPTSPSPPSSLPTTPVADGDTASDASAPPGSEITRDSGTNKLDNGELSSPEDNSVYEEPKQPERPKVPPPTAARRTELPASPKPVETDKDDKGDDGNSERPADDDSNLYSFPPSNQPRFPPPANTIYQVQATHRYSGEDVDELTFDPGEIIYIIPFENPDEQDDGWQMGIKQSDGIKGVFPENFTTRLEAS